MDKKGFGIGDVAPIGVAFIVLTIVLGLGATVVTQMQTSMLSNTTAAAIDDSVAGNVTLSGMSALNTFGTWLPTIALVVVVAIILGIVTIYLMKR
jgi:hypothetical protein